MNIRKIGSRNMLSFVLTITLVVGGIMLLNEEVLANHPDNKHIQSSSNCKLTIDGGSSSTPVTEPFTLTITSTPNGYTIDPTVIKIAQGRSITSINFTDFSLNYGGSSTSSNTLFEPAIFTNIINTSEIKVNCSHAMTSASFRIRANGSSSMPGMMNSFRIIIPPANPTIILDNIEQSSIELSINNRNNRALPNLQRYSFATGQWITIANGVSKFKDTGLQPDTVYRYRTVNTYEGITSYNWQGGNFYAEFTTASDPAVVAAQKAENAAQLAKEAAENCVQYSLDAKTAAEAVSDKVDHPEYGLEALNSKINNTTPYIQRIYNPNGATLTLEQTFDIKINAAGVQENLVYRVICDTFDSGWTKDNLITITGLTRDGTKKATVIVSNNPVDPENGATVKDEFTFFKVVF